MCGKCFNWGQEVGCSKIPYLSFWLREEEYDFAYIEMLSSTCPPILLLHEIWSRLLLLLYLFIHFYCIFPKHLSQPQCQGWAEQMKWPIFLMCLEKAWQGLRDPNVCSREWRAVFNVRLKLERERKRQLILDLPKPRNSEEFSHFQAPNPINLL